MSIRRTYLLDERVVENGPLRVSCRARAVVDAAAVLPDDRARQLMIDVVGLPRNRRHDGNVVVRGRVVGLDDVTLWVEARQTRGRPRLRSIVREAAAGAWSIPEADLAAVVRSSTTLPVPMLNPELRDFRNVG